jgi:hypothetical protein
MTPVNNKSLLAFIFDQMEKLDSNDITVEQAKAQANLAKQANNSLKYEIELVKVKMEIQEFNNVSAISAKPIEFRNAESKNFE